MYFYYKKDEHTLRVNDNRVLRRISGLRREEVVESLRRLHNEELPNLYVSPHRMIKSRRRKWTGHISHIGGIRNSYITVIRKSKGRDHLEDQGVDR
jgi:hypothetical protein